MIRFTCPSTTPEFQVRVSPALTASRSRSMRAASVWWLGGLSRRTATAGRRRRRLRHLQYAALVQLRVATGHPRESGPGRSCSSAMKPSTDTDLSMTAVPAGLSSVSRCPESAGCVLSLLQEINPQHREVDLPRTCPGPGPVSAVRSASPVSSGCRCIARAISGEVRTGAGRPGRPPLRSPRGGWIRSRR